MKLIDLSQAIWHGGPNCPTHPLIDVEIIAQHGADEWQMEKLTLASHTGSHLDAPLHKMPGGKTIDQMPLETFVGRALLADLRPLQPETPVTSQVLAESFKGEKVCDAIILLCTGWGQMRSRDDNWFYHAPFLDGSGANWLVENGARGVGIDHYSVGGALEPRNGDTHAILLGNNVWILEELCFPDEAFAVQSELKLWCLPINLRAHSGAWCRPVLEVA